MVERSYPVAFTPDGAGKDVDLKVAMAIGGIVERGGGGDVSRLLASLLAVTFLLLLTPGDASAPGGLAMLTAIAAAFTIAAVLVCLDRRVTALPHGARASGAVADERRLHGAFRRLSSPDAPGRPRAPGARSAPA